MVPRATWAAGRTKAQVPALCSGTSSVEVAGPVELVFPCWLGMHRAGLRAWPWMNPRVSQGLGGWWPGTADSLPEASHCPPGPRRDSVCGQGYVTPGS